MKFQLREVNDDDHEFLVELHNDPEVLKNITTPTPVTLDSHLEWWNSICNNPRELRLMFTVDGEKTGFTKFYNIDRVNLNCVLGADIHRLYRGRGFSYPMWDLMIDFSFRTLGLHRVSLTTAEYNNIAIKVYRRLGFIEEGRLTQSLYRDGEFHDQLMFFMLRQ